jgi:hypothetical protein
LVCRECVSRLRGGMCRAHRAGTRSPPASCLWTCRTWRNVRGKYLAPCGIDAIKNGRNNMTITERSDPCDGRPDASPCDQALASQPLDELRRRSCGASVAVGSVQQTQFIGGQIWGELTTAVTIPGDPSSRAGAASFAVRPRLSGGRLVGAQMARQGYVVASGENVIYPALQTDAAGRAAMVFTLTGADRYPSAAYATLPDAGISFGAITVAGRGTGLYDPKATGWDYSFAVLDTTVDAVWLATEYIPPKSSQTTTRQRNWARASSRSRCTEPPAAGMSFRRLADFELRHTPCGRARPSTGPTVGGHIQKDTSRQRRRVFTRGPATSPDPEFTSNLGHAAG